MSSQQLFNGTGETVSDAAEAFEKVLTGETVDQEEEQLEAEAEVEADEVEDVNAVDDEAVDVADESEDDQEEETDDEDDGDDDLEDDDGEVDEGEADESAPDMITVKVDGEEVEVPLDELKAGYSRTSDYTKKTQAIAEQRKILEAETAQVQQERAQYSQLLNQLQAQLETGGEKEPDWDNLYEQDPIEWVRQREVWRGKNEQRAAVQAEQQRLSQLQQAEQQRTMQEHLKAENERLLETIPEWSNPKVASAEKTKMREYGVNELGFSEDEMAQVYDRRAVLALRKAMLYDELMKTGKPKAQAKVQKTLKAGSKASSPKPRTKLTKAKQRLAKSGSVRDAAQAFEFLLNS